MDRALALRKGRAELEKARKELASCHRKFVKLDETVARLEKDARNELLLLVDRHIPIDSISHLVMEYLPDFWCCECKNVIPFLTTSKGEKVERCFVCCRSVDEGYYKYRMRGLVKVYKDSALVEFKDQDDIHFAKIAKNNGWMIWHEQEGKYICAASEWLSKLKNRPSLVLANLDFIYGHYSIYNSYQDRDYYYQNLTASDATKVIDDALWI